GAWPHTVAGAAVSRSSDAAGAVPGAAGCGGCNAGIALHGCGPDDVVLSRGGVVGVRAALRDVEISTRAAGGAHHRAEYGRHRRHVRRAISSADDQPE